MVITKHGMMKFQYLLFIFLFFKLLFAQPAWAQVPAAKLDSLEHALVADGFENVGVVQKGKQVYVFFENRRYRWEIDGLSRVLNKTESFCGDSVNIHIIPLHQRVPVTRVDIAAKNQAVSEGRSQAPIKPIPGMSALMNTDSVKSLLRPLKLQNKSFGRIDLNFLPGLRIQLGNPSQPFEYMISISPILQTSLWKGNLLSLQGMIPLHNELQYEYEGKIRMETATINQLFRLPANVFVYASGGVFGFINKNGPNNYFQRYGLSADVRKYLLNGRIGLRFTAGKTGLMSFYHW